MGIHWQITVSKIDFYTTCKSDNRNVKMLSRRLYSPSLEDVAWLDDAQLIFLVFYTFVCIFFPRTASRRFQFYKQMYGKLEKLTERLLAKQQNTTVAL